MLLFYRGSWPGKMTPLSRVHCEGSTWDDVWSNATPCNMEDLPLLPYALKVAVLKDTAWSAMLKAAKEEEADLKEMEDLVSDAQGDDEPTGEKRKHSTNHGDDEKKGSKKGKDGKSPGKNNKKDDKEKKDKKDDKEKKEKKDGKPSGKKGKNDKKNDKKEKKEKKDGKSPAKKKKLAKSSKMTPKKMSKKTTNQTLPKLTPPEYDVAVENVDDCEPFVHNDLHVSVVRQACLEWGAKALVVWTLGAGSAVLAGILQELPTVGLALCDTHLLVAAHIIDSEIANRMQVDFKGNKLYDPDLHSRALKALGADSDQEDTKKKGNEGKAQKGKAESKQEDNEGNFNDQSDDSGDSDEADSGAESSSDE